MMTRHARLWSARVQGVFYRESMRQEAGRSHRRLGANCRDSPWSRGPGRRSGGSDGALTSAAGGSRVRPSR